MENFNSAMFMANLLYDLEMQPEDFEEIGLIAWGLIGNRQTRLYRFKGRVNCVDNSLDLPCNVDIIEAVTYNHEDWNYTTNVNANGDYNSQFVETYIEARKLYDNPLYIPGKYAKFTQSGNTLYFDNDYGDVNVLYKGIIVDDDGLPFINEKEKLAIATYCAYVKKFKEGLITNNANIIQAAQLLEQKWLKQCDAARVPIYLNQNEMNEILDAKTSWNRKLFNKSYKPVK